VYLSLTELLKLIHEITAYELVLRSPLSLYLRMLLLKLRIASFLVALSYFRDISKQLVYPLLPLNSILSYGLNVLEQASVVDDFTAQGFVDFLDLFLLVLLPVVPFFLHLLYFLLLVGLLAFL